MMKNKKLIVVFILIVAFLLVMVNYTKASDATDELPTIITNSNNNNVQNSANNANVNKTNITPNTNSGNNGTLPQTGVQGDTTLFIFIGICIVSAIYAYVKIRKYNNVN